MMETKRFEQIAQYMDSTNLQSDASAAQISRLCQEARELGCAAVCVNPYYVAQAARELAHSSVKVCTVIGFPLGQTTAAVKLFEAQQAIAQGAQELDVVLNQAALKEGRLAEVEQELAAIVALGVTVKVIIECCVLDERQIEAACAAVQRSGAAFVKTSTGMGSGGATVADVALIKKTVGNACRVKAAGGIRSYEQAQSLLAAGANRLGVSRVAAIVSEEQKYEGSR